MLCKKKLNPLPNNKILAMSKLKAFADNNIIVAKINLTKNLKFVLGKVENIFGTGENAGDQHFLQFQRCFLLQGHKIKQSFGRGLMDLRSVKVHVSPQADMDQNVLLLVIL